MRPSFAVAQTASAALHDFFLRKLLPLKTEHLPAALRTRLTWTRLTPAPSTAVAGSVAVPESVQRRLPLIFLQAGFFVREIGLPLSFGVVNDASRPLTGPAELLALRRKWYVLLGSSLGSGALTAAATTPRPAEASGVRLV